MPAVTHGEKKTIKLNGLIVGAQSFQPLTPLHILYVLMLMKLCKMPFFLFPVQPQGLHPLIYSI